MMRLMICVPLFIGIGGVGSVDAQRLTYIEKDKPDVLHPVKAERSLSGMRIMELVFRGLLSRDKTGDPIPLLATDVPQLVQDGKELTVTLREDLKWPDSRPLTATDVQFSYEVFKEPANEYINVNILDIFDGVEVRDPLTVIFRLKKSQNTAVYRLQFPIVPKHLLRRPRYKKGHGYSRQPMGAGPFKIVEVADHFIRFDKNDNYVGSVPSIEGVTVKFNKLDDNHYHQLETGEVHLDPEVPPGKISILEASADIELKPYNSNRWYGFAYNTTRPVVELKEVRQAFSYGFNRAEELTANFSNKGALISGPYTQSSFCYNDTVKPRDYDLDRAKSLLDAASVSYLPGDDLRKYNGAKVKLTMVLSRDLDEVNKRVCASFAQQLEKDLNIKVVVDWLDPKSWEEKVFYDHDFDITFVNWVFDDASNVYSLFSKKHTNPGGNNITQFDDAQVERQLEIFRNSPDPEFRKEAGKKLHARLRELAPYTFLWTIENYAAYRNDRLGHIEIDPFTFFRNIEAWKLAD